MVGEALARALQVLSRMQPQLVRSVPFCVTCGELSLFHRDARHQNLPDVVLVAHIA